MLLYLSYVKYEVNKLALLKKEYALLFFFVSGMVLVIFCNVVLIIMEQIVSDPSLTGQ